LNILLLITTTSLGGTGVFVGVGVGDSVGGTCVFVGVGVGVGDNVAVAVAGTCVEVAVGVAVGGGFMMIGRYTGPGLGGVSWADTSATTNEWNEVIDITIRKNAINLIFMRAFVGHSGSILSSIRTSGFLT